ncbi:hypothetical protein [Kitasatospora sp. NPDC093679]|uniref:hypothetical protein n=1 Tax=Kitasatospora sp. NPDC093679 TaxID=3154983 RepID=UPI003449DE0E
MTRSERKPRRMVVGEEVFLWSVGHDHASDDGEGDGRRCRNLLTVRRAGVNGRLLLVFAEGPGRMVSDGFLPSGAVTTAGGPVLNLHEPGTARAFLDAALAAGAQLPDRTTCAVDGWAFFDAVADLRTAAADGVGA